ncbi:unnamed protein product [Rotaria sp. Silwood1]|nr:unnamed protein product [Rotaria sp. Silwood1]CAF1640785.1 unnamed protein product [Rotaria sp. Silwood1]CAF3840367.1 unnamed protein product [Rotaria sp. Silwood1]CAF3912376.1 unnamed protein product [Rotaria sp. Silwood1]
MPGKSHVVILKFQEPPQAQAQANLLPIFSGFIYASNDVDNNIAQIPCKDIYFSVFPNSCFYELIDISLDFGVVGDFKNTPIWVRNSPLGIVPGLLNAAGNYISNGEYINMTSSHKSSAVLVTAWSSRIVFVEVISGQDNLLLNNNNAR